MGDELFVTEGEALAPLTVTFGEAVTEAVEDVVL